jgi:hypothetical protein
MGVPLVAADFEAFSISSKSLAVSILERSRDMASSRNFFQHFPEKLDTTLLVEFISPN